ncbi:hypothetical protein CVT26_004679 [Gymnopilus dilepis]|uniref:F-box domain-containing protein n=1 Tax=Gymnopilus dilepis TaxID=231916 RepID=A0A409XZ66_9AGAR|nr:hypothetical protein CVT26_004679 [Gymnopilus dilepis]
MGHYDELCLLCGISPIPLSDIYTDPSYGAEDLAEKVIEYDSTLLEDMDLDEEGLQEVLYRALSAESADGLDWFTRPGWRWEGFTRCIAVGHFVVDGDTPHEIVRVDEGCMRKIPDGQGVETRLVDDANCGEFRRVIDETIDEEGNVIETKEEKLSRTSSTNYIYDKLHDLEDSFGNFFVSEGCYHYLQAWLDFAQLPPAQHDRQLTFAGELYEVINSRQQGRVNGMGVLSSLDYDGIEKTLDQTQYDIAENLKVPKHIVASIRNKDPPEELFHSILQDCRHWMFLAPDIWPPREEWPSREPSFSRFPMTTNPAEALKPFPSSVLLNISQFLDSLASYFSLARTSKQLYNTLTDSTFLNQVVKGMAASPSGCLFWLRPVAAMRGEESKAYEALSTYLPPAESKAGDELGTAEKLGPVSPWDHKHFPWHEFVRRCFQSDFMRNRRRLWRQVEQFEEVWRDYRMNGWEVDRFGVSLVTN